MKQVTYLLVLAAGVLLASCGGKSTASNSKNDSIPSSEAEETVEVVDLTTPRAVIMEAYKRVSNFDYEGFINLYDMPVELKKQALKSKNDFLKDLKNKGGFKHFEVLEEQINDKEGTAKVKAKVVCGNGEETNDTHNLVRQKDGTWLMMLDVF